MDKEYSFSEGKSGEIKIKPTFEGKPVVDKVVINTELTDVKGLIELGALVPDAETGIVTVPVKGLLAGVEETTVVFKYEDNDSTVEGVGISTKILGLTINPAQVFTGLIEPSAFKWIPNTEYTVTLNLADEENTAIPTNDPNVNITTDNTNVEILSRSETGFVFRIKDGADPFTGNLVFTSSYYSGQTQAIMYVATKPELTITSNSPAVDNGATVPFPVVVREGEDDVTGSITNLQVPEDNDYLDFNADGSFTIKKADADAVTQTVNYAFDYTKNDLTWSYTAEVNVTINATAEVTLALADVSTPLTMNLWDTAPLAFKVMSGDTDVTSSVTDVTSANQADINDRFEFVNISETSWGYKSVKSSPTEQVTATANIIVHGTHDGTEFSLPANIELVTNVNDGSIPTNRFDVAMS